MVEEHAQPPPAPWAGSPVVEPKAPHRRPRRRWAVAAIVIALVGIAAAAAALAATGRLGRSPLPPRVVLVDPDGGLAIVDGSGGDRIVRAPSGTSFTFPAWSPDGTRVAAVATTGDTVAIRVYGRGADAPADGTTVYASSRDSAPFYLYWTPDGSAITFLTVEGDSLALRSAPADGSAEATVVLRGAPMYWAWEDQDRMLVHRGDNEDAFLGAVRPDGTTISPIEGSLGDFRVPAASRDGRYEAFLVTKPDAGAAVVTTSADGAQRHEVGVFGPAALGFAPSGSRLAFLAADAADHVAAFPIGTLRVVDAATGDVRSLPASRVVAFFWSPDGKRIATIGVVTQGNPGSASLDRRAGVTPTASSPGRLTAVRGGAALGGPDPTLSGFSVGVAFIDIETGQATTVETAEVSPLFVDQVLPYFDQYALSHRIWSPDGASILLPVIGDDGTEQLEVLPADGSAPRVLAPGSMGSWSP